MAQIHLQQGNFTLCSQSLELCLSHNFEVSSPSWTVLLAAKSLWVHMHPCVFRHLLYLQLKWKTLCTYVTFFCSILERVSLPSVRLSRIVKNEVERIRFRGYIKEIFKHSFSTLKITVYMYNSTVKCKQFKNVLIMSSGVTAETASPNGSWLLVHFRSENIRYTTWSMLRLKRKQVSWPRLFRHCRWPWAFRASAELDLHPNPRTRRLSWVLLTVSPSSWS